LLWSLKRDAFAWGEQPYAPGFRLFWLRRGEWLLICKEVMLAGARRGGQRDAVLWREPRFVGCEICLLRFQSLDFLPQFEELGGRPSRQFVGELL
jgi:hypothetical protein